MTDLEIKQSIKNYLCENLGVDPEVLNFDSELFGEEIGLDSIDSIELISFIDDEFGVSMTGVARENFLSIDTLAKYIVENK